MLVCSALNEKVLILEALKLGAIDYITKPFEPEEVEQKLKAVSEIKM